jgi:hypothetical protein
MLGDESRQRCSASRCALHVVTERRELGKLRFLFRLHVAYAVTKNVTRTLAR